MTGLLAVHAHPDDETLSTGALLATWAAAGRPVTVVTCTRGERGEMIPAHLASLTGDIQAVATLREGELVDALAALGVTDHVFLDRVPAPRTDLGRYVDSGMVWLDAGTAGPVPDASDDAFALADLDAAARRLVSVIEEHRPQVVVTYEPGGGYGHPDHVRAHEVTMRAVALADGPEPVVLWAAQDEGDVRRAVDEVARRGSSELPVLDVTGPLPSAVVPSSAVDLRVPLGPVLDRVEAALRAHASQVQAVRTWADGASSAGCFALSNDVLQPLLPDEVYRSAAGDLAAVHWPAGIRVGRG